MTGSSIEVSSGVTVVKVAGASKRFVIRKEKSLKERLVNMGRSKAHKDDFWALRDIDLEIYSGSTVGLIGPNGSGKSTLLKLIGGILQPTAGHGRTPGPAGRAAGAGRGLPPGPDRPGERLPQRVHPRACPASRPPRFFDAIVAFSGIEQFIDTQVKFYSSGMYVRLAFAVSVHVDPDVLLVDEVLAVGDEPFQRKCMDRIRQFQHEGRTIILVTHGLDAVADMCDRAVVLEHGRIALDGDPVDALRHLRADFEAMRQEDIDHQREEAPEEIAQARVTGVSITDPGGEPVSVMTPGAGLLVNVDVSIDGVVHDPVLGISIDSVLGQVVYGINTRLMGLRMDPMTGRSRHTFRLDDVRLGEGQYTIHAAIARDGGVELNRMLNGASLSVHSKGQSIGFLDVDTEFLSEQPRIRVE